MSVRENDFLNLTPQRSAGDQITDICNYVAHSPWIRAMLGTEIRVSVQASKDGSTVMFVFTKLGVSDGVSGA